MFVSDYNKIIKRIGTNIKIFYHRLQNMAMVGKLIMHIFVLLFCPHNYLIVS